MCTHRFLFIFAAGEDNSGAISAPEIPEGETRKAESQKTNQEQGQEVVLLYVQELLYM